MDVTWAVLVLTTATVAAGRPGEAYRNLSDDGAWCWFSDPRAVRHVGDHDRVYTGWVDSAGSIVLGQLDLATGEVTTSVLHEKLQRDDHNNPSFVVRPDGRLLVFYSRHSGDDYYIRLADQPESIVGWSPAVKVKLNDSGHYPQEPGNRYCYSNPFALAAEGGRIYVLWRGLSNKPNWSWSDDGGLTWSPGRIVISPRETYQMQRPYVKAAGNGRDTIHLAFTDGHPRNEPTNGVYYARYRSGQFERADGSVIAAVAALPFDSREADIVYDARLTKVRAWVWDVTEDSAGHPVIVYTRLPAESDHRYHYARWDGQRWLDHEMTAAGGWFPSTPSGEREREPHYSAGVVLDHQNPDVVYLSRPVDGRFELERWTTSNLGRSWQVEPVTSGSRQHNVRPFVIRGQRPGDVGPRVLWMNLDHYRHYTDYRASIRMDWPTE